MGDNDDDNNCNNNDNNNSYIDNDTPALCCVMSLPSQMPCVISSEI